MGNRFRMFFPVVVLISNIKMKGMPISTYGSVVGNLKMVDLMKRKIDIPIGAIVIDMGSPYFQTMGIGKKTVFGIHVAKKGFGLYIARNVTDTKACIGFPSGRIP